MDIAGASGSPRAAGRGEPDRAGASDAAMAVRTPDSESFDAGWPAVLAPEAGTTDPARANADAAVSDEDDASSAEPDDPTQPAPAPAAREWIVSAPRKIGWLIGPDAHYVQEGLKLFGTDLGFSFEHDGQVVMLFGDTYASSQSACDSSEPHSDDLAGTVPLAYEPGVPALRAVTQPSDPTVYRPIQLYRDSTPIVLDAFKVPVAGFSDGTDAYAIFQSQEPVRCSVTDPDSCPAREGVKCAPQIPVCQPAPLTVPRVCELARLLCFSPDCAADECVDTHSSQYDGSARGNAASVLSVVDIAKSRDGDLASYDSVATWQTNSFSHPTVRSVTRFSGKSSDNDYSPGHGALLIWGRAGMVAEEGREARVFLASQTLPLGDGGFAPQYFAGLDDPSGEPRWSADAADAQPLALDGKPGGDPHESVPFVGTTAVSWLGAPIQRWVMLYGGDVGDFMLVDPVGTRDRSEPGAVMMRFADQPWGPWSPPVAHLRPGSPDVVGDMYGPGGILFHPDCADQGDAVCARNAPFSLSALGMCVPSATTEIGRLYSPNIIDAYTRPNPRGGLDISWVVSTWVPYGIAAFETSLDPAPAP